MLRDKNCAVWGCGSGLLKIQITCPEMAAKLEKMPFAKRHGAYGVNYFMRQYVFPKNKLHIVCKNLNIKPK